MENKLEFLMAQIQDLPAILNIIAEARVFMKSQNSGQWQDGTPNEQTIILDINNKHFYVAKIIDEVVGCLALLDEEEGYNNLLTGTWSKQGPYKVIHRFAVKRSHFGRGIASFMLKKVEDLVLANNIRAIRIDTHELNKPMVSLLLKNNYEQRGTALIEKSKLRIVFEKTLI